jgi:hypothetical protein
MVESGGAALAPGLDRDGPPLRVRLLKVDDHDPYPEPLVAKVTMILGCRCQNKANAGVLTIIYSCSAPLGRARR